VEESFDLRLKKDREALACHLPSIDNRIISVSKEAFVDSLENLAAILRDPVWMIYQYGSLRPISVGYGKRVFSLPDAIELGIQLRRLSGFKNFDRLLVGFDNPVQFEDTLFEAQVASFLSSLDSVSRLVFSPQHKIRNRIKVPEFDVYGETFTVSVECKRPHMFVQNAAKGFERVTSCLKGAIETIQWPVHLRLEVEIAEPLKGSLEDCVKDMVHRAIEISRTGREAFSVGPFHAFIVDRAAPFKIIDPQFGTDVMVLDQDRATGLFNPEFTRLRVVSNRLDPKFAKSIGSRVNQAIGQLPQEQNSLIFIGDVPFRIAERVCKPRLSDPAYKHVRAFGILDDSQFRFIFRSVDREFVERLLSRVTDGLNQPPSPQV